MKYYCRDQFKTISIVPGMGQKAKVSPCCASTTAPVDADEFDFVNNPHLSEIRQNVQLDVAPTPCHKCWQMESFAQPSRRNGVNSGQDIDTTVEVQRVDITCQNICNLACIQCHPGVSSTWAEELGHTKVPGSSYENKLKLFSRLDHTTIQHIHFTGGEPLMTTEHFKILQIMDEHADLSKLRVSYNTNGTFYPDDTVIAQWAKLKNLQLVISIDAVGDTAEYIRYHSDWDEIAENISKFNQLKSKLFLSGCRLGLSFLCCVSNYNLLELPAIIEFTKPYGRLEFQFNHNPYQAPNIIPEDKVSIVNQTLSSYPELAGVLNMVNHRPTALALEAGLNIYRHEMKKIDSRRKTDWTQYIKIQ